MTEEDRMQERLQAFLRGSGFAVLTWNEGDPSPHGQFEAWAYRGPLDFDAASPVTFGVGHDLTAAQSALNELLGSKATEPCDRHPTVRGILCNRELATVLAALRFHQDENLQGHAEIPDQAIREIAMDGCTAKPLSFDEVDRLCEKLNDNAAKETGFLVEPPQQEDGDEPLFRVIYVIDLNATGPREAAEEAYRIMVDSDSMPPVLDALDHTGRITRLDLSDERTRKGGEAR